MQELSRTESFGRGRSASILQHGESEFRRLLEKLPAGAYTCDRDGLITYFNQHAVQLWGRSPRLNDPVDRFCGSFKLFATDGTPITHDQCWMAKALQEQVEYNGHEIVVERPDGYRLTALAHANPIHDETGALIGAVNVLVDISERKRAENALRAADRAKNEFLATLAHELRGPLAPIRNALQILELKGALSPESQWAVGVLDRQVRQMTRLIDDLLDVARITSNRLELRTERVELTALVNAAVETVRKLFDEAGQDVTVTVPSEPVYLQGDMARLAQVISNLLNNATKYTGHGGHVAVTAERQGKEAVISVQDTGVGIPAAMLPGIFDMFTQADPARSHGGLGVGLTIVRRLVQMHGGTVTAHSEGAGQGSTFTVRLPLVEAAHALPGAKVASEFVRAASPLRIVVVDDNRDAAASLDLLLQLMGHDVSTANEGLEALVVAERFHPDVVLLDIGLPGLDGYQVAQRLRQKGWGKGMVLIAVSGWGQEADRRRSQEAGFDHHLVKPVDPAVLAQLLSSVRQTAVA